MLMLLPSIDTSSSNTSKSTNYIYIQRLAHMHTNVNPYGYIHLAAGHMGITTWTGGHVAMSTPTVHCISNWPAAQHADQLIEV